MGNLEHISVHSVPNTGRGQLLDEPPYFFLRSLITRHIVGPEKNLYCIHADSNNILTSLGASNFVDWYYRTLREGNSIAPFYATNNAKYAAANTASDISINGALLSGGPDEYEKLLLNQRATPTGTLPASKIRWDIDSWDVQIINPDFAVACPPELADANNNSNPGAGGRESLLLQVAGQISYGSDKDAHKKAFSETFVLVPNWDALRRNPPRNLRRRLILSQNFRAL